MDQKMPLSGRTPDINQLRQTLWGGQAKYVPALELLHDIEVKEAFLGRPIRDFEDDVEFYHLAGYDYYSAWLSFFEVRHYVDEQVKRRRSSTDKAYENKRQREWAPSRGEGLVQSISDLEAFPWPAPDEGTLVLSTGGIEPVGLDEGIKRICSNLPSGMGLILCADGIFERFTKDLMGYEDFCYKLYEDPELIWRTFAIVGELWAHLFERAAALPQVDALWLADDIAYSEGLMFNPEIMREHLFPWYRKISQAASRYDKPMLFHSDGDLRPIMEDLIDCGFNALHPIEPKAMDITEIKQKYGDHLCLVGNIDLGGVLTLGTPEDVREEVHERIRTVAPGGGYCVGSSNSVTNYVPLENFIAMLKATYELGVYPIS